LSNSWFRNSARERRKISDVANQRDTFSRLSRFNIINWLAPDVIVEDSVISRNITHARNITCVNCATNENLFKKVHTITLATIIIASFSGRHLLYPVLVSLSWLSMIRVINKNNYGLEICKRQNWINCETKPAGGCNLWKTDTRLGHGSRFAKIIGFSSRYDSKPIITISKEWRGWEIRNK